MKLNLNILKHPIFEQESDRLLYKLGKQLNKYGKQAKGKLKPGKEQSLHAVGRRRASQNKTIELKEKGCHHSAKPSPSNVDGRTKHHTSWSSSFHVRVGHPWRRYIHIVPTRSVSACHAAGGLGGVGTNQSMIPQPPRQAYGRYPRCNHTWSMTRSFLPKLFPQGLAPLFQKR